MWQIDRCDADGNRLPQDIQKTVEQLAIRFDAKHPSIRPFFNGDATLIAARAPGRLDVMGGIADYSGSTVLQLPLAESAVVLCQQIAEPKMVIMSCGQDDSHDMLQFAAPLSDFQSDKHQSTSQYLLHMQHYFAALPDNQQWAAYVAGVLCVLIVEFDLKLMHGIVLCLDSTVPVGKGVSSSAAIEVATMRAIVRLLQLDISAHQQAVLCQRVENFIVGAPCGLMDQMTSSAGTKGQLLTLLCQPYTVKEPTPLPADLTVWGIDSGLRHSVSGADYGSVRTAAFMGYRLLLEFVGVAPSNIPAANIVDSKWHGYLANIDVSEFDQHLASVLPESMSGAEFLQRFDATTDTVTTVKPDTIYAVRACTAHPIREHFRVRLFSSLSGALARGPWCLDSAQLLGECMYQSHASYSQCGLGSSGTDDIVEGLRRAGLEQGIYGARITGGGSGGTVSVLTHANAGDTIRSVAEQYKRSKGIGGYVFKGSSDGASSHIVMPA